MPLLVALFWTFATTVLNIFGAKIPWKFVFAPWIFIMLVASFLGFCFGVIQLI